MSATTPQMQCRHVFTDGRRCAAACLRHEPFCYYHHTTRRPVQNAPARRRRSATFTLPELEDRAAIQLALSEVLQRIASNDIDPKRAGHLLFGLQIATSLLPKEDPKAKTQPKTVAEITHDEELGDLAPVAEIGHDHEPSELELLIADFDRRKAEREAASAPALAPEPEHEPEEETLPTEHEELTTCNVELPTLQATAAKHTRPAKKLLLRPSVDTLGTTQLRGSHAPQPSFPARRRRPALAARAPRPAARRRRSHLQRPGC